MVKNLEVLAPLCPVLEAVAPLLSEVAILHLAKLAILHLAKLANLHLGVVAPLLSEV